MILGDCAVESVPDGLLATECRVVPVTGGASVRFVYPGPRRSLDAFLSSVVDAGGPEWRVEGDTVLFAGENWRPIVSNCAVNLTLAVQDDVLFFHAASISVHGRGVMLAGAKGSGKSTFSLALASKGHALLGDEMAGVHLPSGELLPLRRAVSIREGPRASAVNERLERATVQEEKYPDNSLRIRARISDLFDVTPPPATTLGVILFLRSFQAHAGVERLVPAMGDTSLLQALGSSLWTSGEKLSRRFRLLQLLSSHPLFYLDAGPADETAEFIETLVENL